MCEKCGELQELVKALRAENSRLWEITQARGLNMPVPVSKREARARQSILRQGVK
jgi:hypothetical protein